MFDLLPLSLLVLLLVPLMGATVTTDWIDVFRAGDYPQGTYTAQDVQRIADSYDPDFFEAPGTVDHQQSGFANGLISKVKAVGETLYVKFRKMPKEFAQMIKDGRLRNRSIELFQDLDGKGLYLKAVTWLGAKPPQVKGLSDAAGKINFSHEHLQQRTAIVHFEEQPEKDGGEQDPPKDDPPKDDPPTDEPSGEDSEGHAQDNDSGSDDGDPDEDDDGEGAGNPDDHSEGEEDEQVEFADESTRILFEKIRAERDEARKELQKTKGKVKDKEREQRREAFDAFCSERIPPSVRESAFSVFDALASGEEDDVITFSHENHESATDAFKDVMEALSFGHLFGTFAAEPDDKTDGPGDLEDAVREAMAEQGLT